MPQKSMNGAARTDSPSREALIDAAVSAILELGYYRASSNEIARRAGVTWGVIQYHFRTREGLLLAAFEDACETLIQASTTVEIRGDSTYERLNSYFDFLMGFYGRPAYLAYIQIQLNLVRDPRSSGAALAAIRRVAARLHGANMQPAGEFSDRYSGLVFESLRGLILSHLLRADPLTSAEPDDHETFTARADELIIALAAHIDAAGAAGRVPDAAAP